MASMLWIGTRKGLFSLRPDARRRGWRLSGPQMLGHIIHHVVQDPREPRRLVLAAKTGHLGPTVYTSIDRGRHWQEALTPPAFRKVAEGEKPRAVERVFWLTPGHASEPGAWYAGSSPAGLFRSEDHGAQGRPACARPTASCCIRCVSIRATRGTCTWRSRSAGCSNPPMAARTGRPSTKASPRISCPIRTPLTVTI